MRVLISGAGPAGLTLAASLVRHGLSPVVVERAPMARAAGYAVGVHVNGWNVASRLGIIEALRGRALALGEAEYRNRVNSRLFSYSYRHLAAASGGRMLAVMRDDLQWVLLDLVKGQAEIRYDTTIAELRERSDAVEAVFSDGRIESFDLVAAADGYRSGVRELWFGPHEHFLRPLGYRAAAWRLPMDREEREGFVGFMDIDLQAGLYRVDSRSIATLFCWRDADTERVPYEARRALLERHFEHWPEQITATFRGDIDWEASFFDTVYQVEMERWSRGRVVLVGDAAHCLTFLSGQGTSTAMAGAYVLARELAAHPYETAFANYETRLRPLAERQQKQSRRIGGYFVPRSTLGMRLQSYLVPLMTRPPLVRLMAKRMGSTAIALD